MKILSFVASASIMVLASFYLMQNLKLSWCSVEQKDSIIKLIEAGLHDKSLIQKIISNKHCHFNLYYQTPKVVVYGKNKIYTFDLSTSGKVSNQK
jgi:hypothetical protein